MRYFIDFEATQFKQTIISIGCYCENGQSFYCLVRPSGKDKLSGYITKLTGITKEMLDKSGLTADEAFNNLFAFIESTTDGSVPQYYCYGNNDQEFIENTIAYMKDTFAIMVALAIKGGLIDYSKEVKKFFNMSNPFSLRKIYTFLREEEVDMCHNALEDAQMLALVVNNLKEKCTLADKDKISAIPKEVKPELTNPPKKAPQKFIEWPNDKWEADTCGPDQTPAVKAIGQNGKEKTFDSIDTAVMWAIRYLTTGMSIKKDEHIKKVKQKIIESAKKNKNSYNLKWYLMEKE